jgi:hypothetical protein
MTLCVIGGGHCVCQPQDGVFCPNAKTDADRCKVAKAYRDIPWDDAQEAGAREPVAWAEKDGDEWVVHDTESKVGREIKRAPDFYGVGVSIFPIYAHPPTTGAIEALRELVAIEDDWAQRGFIRGRTPREFYAWKAARAALAPPSP